MADARAAKAIIINPGFGLFLFIAVMLFSSAKNQEIQEQQQLLASMESYSSEPPQAAAAHPPTTKFPTRGSSEGSLEPEECSPRCAMRCSNTQYKKPCLFFCNKCCAKCLCVPPGTYGNKNYCPCYDNWKTKRGGPKCP